MALMALETQAHPSWGIAVGPQGQVYFSDLKTVWKIDPQGKLSIFRAADAMSRLVGCWQSSPPPDCELTDLTLSPDGKTTTLATVTPDSPSSANPPADGNRSSNAPQTKLTQYTWYPLIAAGAGLLVVAAIGWRVWKKSTQKCHAGPEVERL